MITNKLNLPTPFVNAVTREYQYKEKQYSVTSMLKGTCQVLLERRHAGEIETDVSDMIWALFGSACHSILEQAKETDDQLKENHLVIDVGDYKLSGIFDLYDAKEKKVTDYKTGSIWKVQFDDFEDYRKQLLMYAYMLRSIGFECDKGEIVMILKDHSKTKAKFDSNYPQFPVYIKSFNFSDKDIEEIEKYITDKFNEIKELEGVSDELLPPCSKAERWHRDDTYAVMKKGRKTAVKLCPTKEEAEKYIEGLDNNYFIEFREGKDSRCDEYCTVCKFCKYWRLKNGTL